MAKESIFSLKHLLLAAFFLLPVLFYFQSREHFFKKMELKGDVVSAGKASFSLAGWFSGDYQAAMDQYVNDNFGFRNVFVRINNQLEYDLFKKANARDVVIGKDNFLFEGSYIRAYFGTDFIGEDKIRERAERLKYIQDTLAKLNKTLIVIFAPSKASFYPEYIPDSFYKTRGKTNYETYARYANSLNLNHIDFNRYFIENKNKSKYPLYPQYGVHWSFYGTCLATDSLIKYMEKKRHIKMPHIFWNHVDVKNKYAFSDYDIADGMNLLFKFNKQMLAYPNVQFQSADGKTKPSVLVVADSHYWGMFNLGISQAFSHNDFWYYNRQIYSEVEHGLVTPGQLDMKKEVEKHDVFMIMATESTIGDMGWGFIENLYNHFKGYDARIPHFKELVDNKKAYIKTDEKWMTEIKEKAQKRNISVDSMVTLDAIWVIEDGYKKLVDEQRNSIMLNTKWMDQIKGKAQERRISIDSMVTLDAMWVIDNAQWAADAERAKKIAEIRQTIKQNPEWMAQIPKKALARHVSIDSMMTIDAIWYLDKMNSKRSDDYQRRIAQMKNNIISTPEWMEQVRKKAHDRHVSVDSMITLDAIWAVENPGKH